MATDIPTEIDLAAIESRLTAATPGPWYTHYADDDLFMNATVVTSSPDESMMSQDETINSHEEVVAVALYQACRIACHADGRWDENADLIAHAPTDIRALLDEVRRLRNELDAAERHHEHSMCIIETALGPCHQDMDTWRAQGIANDIRDMRAALQERSSE